jgi:predicted nucleic acid-binding protein
MKKIYFDSSVYTKVFAKEEGSDTAKRIIKLAETTNDIQIIMSVWTINEVISAIDKKAYQTHEINEKESKQAIATVLQRSIEYPRTGKSNIYFARVEHDIIKESTVLIHSLHISADDALHVFTAFYHNCEYFICRDKELKRKIHKQISVTQHNAHNPKMVVLDITNEEDMKLLLKS